MKASQPVRFVPVSKTEDAVVFSVGFNCRECYADITHQEWKDYAKMCKRCWDKEGTWED